MKIVSFFLAIVVMASVLISCKKDKPEAVITGKWEGKFGELTETPAYHYGFVVKPDGTLVRINPNGLVEGLGEWGAIGTAFTGWYTMGSENYKFSLAGTYDEPAGKITGTWGMGDNTENGGLFFLKMK